VLALAAFGVLAHEIARRVLDDELGRRLALAAAGTAGLVLPEQMSALTAEQAERPPGGAEGESLTLANVQRRLGIARERFDVRRALLVAPTSDDTKFVARVDTEGRLPPGSEAHELGADRLELARAAAGRPTASPLFIGHDQLPYKRGYAAIGANPIAGFAVVEASADYLVPLRAFRRQLIIGGATALAIVLGVTIWMARRVSGPVVRLAAAAERIGRGNLDAPVPMESSDEVGLLARTIDRMRAALKARDERLQMMLAGIAHEVRNPLGGLELYAGLLREALADNPERVEEVRRIEREVHYLKIVVAEFLEYARRPSPELTPLGLRALVDEIRDLAGDPTAAKTTAPARIDTDVDRALRVRADAGQLRRALLNLVRNATAAVTRNHPEGGGHIQVSASRADAGRVRVVVDDDGPGVDPALRDKIFTPFFTTREKGTGLGLAFVREIIHDHGGDIHVEEAPGGGARFTFDLPAAEDAPP
ncbi:MAG TPA: HAMP domain-containing sensor histidine kinase, partial [Polyangia bacterium]